MTRNHGPIPWPSNETIEACQSVFFSSSSSSSYPREHVAIFTLERFEIRSTRTIPGNKKLTEKRVRSRAEFGSGRGRGNNDRDSSAICGAL